MAPQSRSEFPFLIAEHPFDSRSLDSAHIERDPTAQCLSFGIHDLAYVHFAHSSGWTDVTMVKSCERGWVPIDYFVGYSDPRAIPLLAAVAAFLANPKSQKVARVRAQLLTSTGASTISSGYTFSEPAINEIISGTKLLLDKTGALSRDARLVKEIPGIAASRKALLTELAHIVRKAQIHKNSTEDVVVEKLVRSCYRLLNNALTLLKVADQPEVRQQMNPPQRRLSKHSESSRHSRSSRHSTSSRRSHSSRLSLSPHRSRRSSVHSSPTKRLSRSEASLSQRSSDSNAFNLSHPGTGVLSGPAPNPVDRLQMVINAFVHYLRGFLEPESHLLRDPADPNTSSSILALTRQSMLACREILPVLDLAPPALLESSRDELLEEIRRLVSSARSVVAALPPSPSSTLAAAVGPMTASAHKCLDLCLLTAHSCYTFLKAHPEVELTADWSYPEFNVGEVVDLHQSEPAKMLPTTIEERPTDMVAIKEDAELSHTAETNHAPTSSESYAPGSHHSGREIEKKRLSSRSVANESKEETPQPTADAMSVSTDSTISDEEHHHSELHSSRLRKDASDHSDRGSVTADADSNTSSSSSAASTLGNTSSDGVPSTQSSIVRVSSDNSQKTEGSTENKPAPAKKRAHSEGPPPRGASLFHSIKQGSRTPSQTRSFSQSSFTVGSRTVSQASNSSQSSVSVASTNSGKTVSTSPLVYINGKVRGGTLSGLVSWLAGPEYDRLEIDIRAFLLCFRLFASPRELLMELGSAQLSPQGVKHLATVWVQSFWEPNDNVLQSLKPWLDSRLVAAKLALLRTAPEDQVLPLPLNPDRKFYQNLVNNNRNPSRVGSGSASNPRHAHAARSQSIANHLTSPFGGTSALHLAQSFRDFSIGGRRISRLPDESREKSTPVVAGLRSRSRGDLRSDPGSEASSMKSVANATDAAEQLLEYTSNEVAQQITLMWHATFCRFRASELIDQRFSSSKRPLGLAPNAGKFIEASNQLSSFVNDTILNSDLQVKQRTRVLKQWIKIADDLYTLGNLNGVVLIVAVLQSASIYRLHRVWESLSAKYHSIFNRLKPLTSLNRNFADYRRDLQGRYGEPCVPYLGCLLNDLTLTDEGNPKTLRTPKCINFERYRRQCQLIAALEPFQAVRYDITPDPLLQQWLNDQMSDSHSRETRDGDNHWRRSLFIQPERD